MKKLIVKETTYNTLLTVAETMDAITLMVKGAILELAGASVIALICLTVFVTILKIWA